MRFNATKCYYHVNKEKDPQILSTWRAHIRTSRFKSISWTPNIRRPQMEYTYIEYHKEGQFNHQLPQTKFITLSEGMQEKCLHLISYICRSVLEYGATICITTLRNQKKFKEEELDLLIKRRRMYSQNAKRTKPYHTGRKTETTTSHIFLQGGRGVDTSNAFL